MLVKEAAFMTAIPQTLMDRSQSAMHRWIMRYNEDPDFVLTAARAFNIEFSDLQEYNAARAAERRKGQPKGKIKGEQKGTGKGIGKHNSKNASLSASPYHRQEDHPQYHPSTWTQNSWGEASSSSQANPNAWRSSNLQWHTSAWTQPR